MATTPTTAKPNLPPKNKGGGTTSNLKSIEMKLLEEAQPVAAPAVRDGNDQAGEGSVTPKASSAKPVASAPPAPAAPVAPRGPRRRRPRATITPRAVRTASLLVVLAGGASYLAYDQTARVALTSTWSSLRDQATVLRDPLSSALHSIHCIPSLSRTVLAGTRSAASSSAGAGGRGVWSVESAELAWEQSEDAFRQLRQYNPEEGGRRRHSPLERVWEGLEEIFSLRRRGEAGRSGRQRNNVRREGNRRMKADTQNEDEGLTDDLASTLARSPLAAPLLALCALVLSFFVAKFLLLNPGPGRDERYRALVLDDQEAEIVEFYEMEAMMACEGHIPFLGELEEGNNDRPHPPLRRLGSAERNLSDESLHRRLARPPSLGEMRESQCDLYYSRVLHDIETLNYEDDDDEEVEAVGMEGLRAKEGEGGCQITLLENISSLTEEDGIAGEPDKMPESDTECFQSAHSVVQEEEPQRPQSPQSSSSSISSLTSEGYDIEAPTMDGHSFHGGGVETAHEGKAQSPLYAWESPPRRSQSLPDGPDHAAFCGQATPPTSNVRKERSRSLTETGEATLPRRVSFNPEVGIREIPREARHHELSPEGYLYVMLFAVAVAIAAFSLFPAHPSLSPIYTATRDEILERAESILNSQWDVEL